MTGNQKGRTVSEGQRYFEDVHVGEILTSRTEVIDHTRLFFFSAATYNGHRIHYDWRWATDVEGHPDILVHGPLQAAVMASLLTDWAGPRGSLVRLALRHQASAYPDRPLQFNATVVARRAHEGGGLVDLKVEERAEDGTLLMPGEATVRLPHASGDGRG